MRAVNNLIFTQCLFFDRKKICKRVKGSCLKIIFVLFRSLAKIPVRSLTFRSLIDKPFLILFLILVLILIWLSWGFVVFNCHTITIILFWDTLIFYEVILSPQLKRSVIISNKHNIYELPHELPSSSQNLNTSKILLKNRN